MLILVLGSNTLRQALFIISVPLVTFDNISSAVAMMLFVAVFIPFLGEIEGAFQN